MGAIVLFFMIFEIIDMKRIIWVEIIDVFIINITYSFDFNKKELEPIPFDNLPLTFADMFNLTKFTELLKGDKKD